MAKKKRTTPSWVLALGAAAAGVAAGVAVERAVVGRLRNQPDPEASEPLGTLRGTPIGPVESFDGTNLHVEVVGEGPTVILSHGYSLNLTLWHYQIRDLASRYRLVLFDHRGHGRSEPARDGDWSIEALAHDLQAVVRAAGDGSVAIVAHSMGGMAAMKFFEMFGDDDGRVNGLVLVDTTAADVTPAMLPMMPRRLRAAWQGVEAVAMRAVVSLDRPSVDKLRRRASDIAWLMVRTMGFGPNASPSQVAFFEKMLSETPVDTWFDLLPAVTGVDVTEALERIRVPTLVIVGTRDRLTPPGAAERIVAGIPGARLGRIAGAGHSPMLESPQTFNARLRMFLEGLEWKTPGVEAARTVESAGS